MARKRNGDVTLVNSPVGLVLGPLYGPQYPVAPERFYRSQSEPNIRWSGMVDRGENPQGFTSQVPSGTSHDRGDGWNDAPWANRANGKFSRKVSWGRFGNRSGE